MFVGALHLPFSGNSMNISSWGLLLHDFINVSFERLPFILAIFFFRESKKSKKPGPGHILPMDTEMAQCQFLDFCEYISDGEVSSPSLLLRL